MRALKRALRYIGAVLSLLLSVIYILPILLLVINSFKSQGEIVKNFLALPTSLYLDNIKKAMDILQYWLSFRNTAIITVLVIVGACTVSFMCAYGASHLGKRLSGAIFLLFVIGQMIPFHAIMVPVYLMASKMNMINSFIGIALFCCGFNAAFGMTMYTGFLKTVPRELEEAAEIDGSSIFSTMFRIVFPLIGPTTATISVLFFLWTWNDFLFPSLMLSDANHRTLMVNIANFRTTTTTRWDLMIAGLIICMLPVVIFYLCVQKYIVKELTMGAIK